MMTTNDKLERAIGTIARVWSIGSLSFLAVVTLAAGLPIVFGVSLVGVAVMIKG
jgi:hypothetical protein